MRYRSATLLGIAILAALVACGVPSSASQEAAPPAPTETTTLPAPTLTPVPVPSAVYDRYAVRRGETLGYIASRFGLTIDELQKANNLDNPHALQVGQVLKIPIQVTRVAPDNFMLPDSEVVYGPAYASFDTIAYASRANGYLASYRDKVEGESLSGPQIIQLVSERYSVGPRVLLALLEYEGGWVTRTGLAQSQVSSPMGLVDSGRTSLFHQASWAANLLNEGYYGRLSGQLGAFRFKDRSRARLAPSINPGTAAIQDLLAQVSTWDAWQKDVSPNGFMATYRRLFGDPNQYKVDPLIPPDLRQPPLRLFWNENSVWYFTGGPHSGWGDQAAWSAIDVTPPDTAGAGVCTPSKEWVLAAAPGRVVKSEHGRVLVSLEGKDFQGSGWTLLYMHLGTAGRATVGAQLNTGDRIGHPACEGGWANATHTHFARLYNGQWIGVDTMPLVLSGWTVTSLGQEYEGLMTRGAESLKACNCRDDAKNAIRPETVAR
jgi:LasA protease